MLNTAYCHRLSFTVTKNRITLQSFLDELVLGRVCFLMDSISNFGVQKTEQKIDSGMF